MDPQSRRRRPRLLAAVACAGAVSALAYWRYYERTKPFPLDGTMTEVFLELTAGEKFRKCGFFKTMLLPDYSISNDCREKPFVYTHQPSGPSVLIGLLRLAGLDFPRLRLPYALLSFLGVASLIVFFESVTGSALAAAAAGVYAVCSFDSFLQWSDHAYHALFWPLYFGSMAAFVALGDGRWNRVARYSSLLLTLSSSIFLSISVMVTQCLFALLSREKRFRRRFWESFLLAAGFTGLWFARNVAYLGWPVAVRDIGYTLTNRIWAVPSRSELARFYQSHGLVLWGIEFARPGRISAWLGHYFGEYRLYFLILAAAAAYRRRSQGAWTPPIKIFAVIFGLFCWYFIFVTLGENYLLPYLIRTAGGLVVAGSASELWSCGLEVLKKVPARFAGLARCAGVCLAVFAYGVFVFDASQYVYEAARDAVPRRPSPLLQGLEALRALPPTATVWTNIDSLVLRYFTPAVVVGSCAEAAFRTRNIDRCFGAFFDEKSQTARQARAPGYFFFSDEFVPGAVLCRHECLERLAKDMAKKGVLLGSADTYFWFIRLAPKPGPLELQHGRPRPGEQPAQGVDDPGGGRE